LQIYLKTTSFHNTLKKIEFNFCNLFYEKELYFFTIYNFIL
jgi:hypothetical protein